VGTAIPFILSDNATGKKGIFKFSQDEYWGKFCSSLVRTFTADTTALSKHTLVGCFIPYLRCTSSWIGAPPSIIMILNKDWCSCIFFPAMYTPISAYLLEYAHLNLDLSFWMPFSSPYHLIIASLLGKILLNYCPHLCTGFGTALFHFELNTPHLALSWSDRCSLIMLSTSWPVNLVSSILFYLPSSLTVLPYFHTAFTIMNS